MEKMKKCKYCQSEIPSKASVCPVCKKTLKHKGFGAVCLIFGAIILAVVIISSGSSKSGSGASTSSLTSEREYATIDEFNQIEMGMSYEEVCNIIGCEGTVTSESGVDNITMTLYTWYGWDGITNMNVTFENGVAIAKAQCLSK